MAKANGACTPVTSGIFPSSLPIIFPVPLRNSRAFLYPLAHLLSGFRLSHGWFSSAIAWIPSGGHQRIFSDVMNDLFQRLASVLFRVFELARQFSWRFSLKHHAH